MQFFRAVACIVLALVVLYLGPTLSLRLAPTSTPEQCVGEAEETSRRKEEGGACKLWIWDSKKCMDGKTNAAGACKPVATPLAIGSVVLAALLVLMAVVFMFRSSAAKSPSNRP